MSDKRSHDDDTDELTASDPLADLGADMLDALDGETPPADFAAQVSRAWQQERDAATPAAPPAARPSPLRRAVVPLAAAAAAALLVVGVQRLPAAPASGQLQAVAREEVRLGERGVAVAEAGAALRWDVEGSGRARLVQERGHVFYRVEPGETFEVETPAGTARVTGTCFSLEVTPMPIDKKSARIGALAGAAGTAAVTAVLLTVFEGGVVLANQGEEVAVVAGQSAKASTTEAPRVLPEERARALGAENELLAAQTRSLREQVGELEGQLKAMMIARANGEDPVVADNERMRDELARLRRDLDVERQLRSSSEGEEVPFPDDLPAKYTEGPLKSAFLDMFSDAGLAGDVIAIDCSEYPCIVYGEMEVGGDRAAMDKAWVALEHALHERFPAEESNHSIRNSTFRKDKEEAKSVFGIALTPKSHDRSDEQRKNQNKRVRLRNQEFMDALQTH
jgi:hypothetical protein